MRIHKFGLICTGVFALVATFVAIIFYINERSLLLQTVVDDLQRNIYQIEDEVKHALQADRPSEVQKILDLAPVLNKNIASVSLSREHVVINKSSDRSLRGSMVTDDYLPMSMLHKEIFSTHTKFRSNFSYFQNGKRVDGLLLVAINERHVFGRLTQVAIFYIALVLFIIVLGSYTSYLMMRQLIIRPLEQVTIHARDASATSEKHFITELSELDNTLTVSFEKLKSKKNELQASLNETLYLQRMLKTVADINHLLISSENIDDLLNSSAERLAVHCDYNACWIALMSDGDLIIASTSENKDNVPIGTVLANAVLDYDDPICQSLIQRHSKSVTNLSIQDQLYRWQALSAQSNHGSFISIPLITSIREQAIGVVCIFSDNPDGFTDKEISMLEELAGDIGFAVNAFRQRYELEHHLTTCNLTELPNRVSLVDRLDTNPNMVVAVINIDRFNEINDVYGVDIGDKLLVEYSNWLREKTAIFPDIMLHKLPGDVYAITTNASESLELERFTDILEDIVNETDKSTFLINDIEILLSVTVGVAWPSKRVIEHAVQAVKSAKAARKRIQVYENMPHNHNFSGNLSWYKRIKSAISESRFVPYFQPIVDNKTKKIIKYEALIRLINEDGSRESPLVFLDISKKMRLYSHLTMIMVEKTCEVFKDKSVPVSINLSIEDLFNDDLANKIEETIIRYHMGNRIEFEILETESIHDYEKAKLFIDRFRSIGCRFAIDDFGSGYSNFDQVLKLNVDTVKIDGSLIKNIQHDTNARIFVHHITDLARELGIKTVAEYVSNEDIHNLVKEIGIDFSQGFYFYEPATTLVE
jgi:diguanylate cyclase (GGDEF)-like protein